MDKRSGSNELRESENGAAVERRVGEGSWIDVTSESADNLGPAGLMRGGRPATEDDCDGWRGRADVIVVWDESGGVEGREGMGEGLLGPFDGILAATIGD